MCVAPFAFSRLAAASIAGEVRKMDWKKIMRVAYIALAVAATVFVGGAIVGYLDCGPGRNACKPSGEVTGTRP
jgi:hypothetical protein